MQQIGIITQARTGSTRLPQKIFKEVSGKPLLYYHLHRLQDCRLPVYIATTTLKADDAIVNYAEELGIPYYRGSEDDVLSRFYNLAVHFGLNAIVRVTSDCPLIDGEVIRQGVDDFLHKKKQCKYLYLSNTIERTYPRGFDFEIFSFDLLKLAHQHASLKEEREHVTPYIWRGKAQGTEIYQQKAEKDKSFYRLTVDTPEDFTLIERLITNFKADNLAAKDIIEIMDNHPELCEINNHIEQVKIENEDLSKGGRK